MQKQQYLAQLLPVVLLVLEMLQCSKPFLDFLIQTNVRMQNGEWRDRVLYCALKPIMQISA